MSSRLETVIDSVVSVFCVYWFIFAKYAPRATARQTNSEKKIPSLEKNGKRSSETRARVNFIPDYPKTRRNGRNSNLWTWRWQLTRVCAQLSAVAPARVKRRSSRISPFPAAFLLLPRFRSPLHFTFPLRRKRTTIAASYSLQRQYRALWKSRRARTSWADSWDETGVIRPVQLGVIES